MANADTIWQALEKARKSFGSVVADNTARVTSSKGSYTYQYADLGSVLEAIMPALEENQLLLMQPVANVNGLPVVRTVLIHTPSGEKIESDAVIVWSDPNDPQKYGGGITYTRRYSLTSLFALNVEDDDAAHASQPRTSYVAQAQAPRGDWTEERANTRPSATVTDAPSPAQMNMMNALLPKVYGDKWEDDPDLVEEMQQRMHSLTGVTSRKLLTRKTISPYLDWLKSASE
jgi:ERF superfamily